MISPSRLAARKPSPKYMIGSIMKNRLRPRPREVLYKKATRQGPTPARARVNLNRRTGQQDDGNGILERVPRRLRSEFQIPDIRAEPQAHAGADRHHHDPTRRERGHADAADQIGRA